MIDRYDPAAPVEERLTFLDRLLMEKYRWVLEDRIVIDGEVMMPRPSVEVCAETLANRVHTDGLYAGPRDEDGRPVPDGQLLGDCIEVVRRRSK